MHGRGYSEEEYDFPVVGVAVLVWGRGVLVGWARLVLCHLA